MVTSQWLSAFTSFLFLLSVSVFAEDVIISIGSPSQSNPLPPSLLGTHLGSNYRLADWSASTEKRFPECGWNNGGLFRHFIANNSERIVQRLGQPIVLPARTWWGHIQSEEADRGGNADAKYQWMECDVWQNLDYVESLHGENFIVTSGFPDLSKETAAALVAFCNGAIADERVIGVDRLGTDWKTVGYWASIRAHGDRRHKPHPEPYRVKWWELGNELYDPHSGADNSWLKIADYHNTKAGRNNVTRAQYFMSGRKIGEITYDGYLAFRSAMKLVDPSIQIGAMLAPEHKGAWYCDWNETLLKEGHGQIDFISCHPYGRSKGLTPEEIICQPQKDVRVFFDAIHQRLSAHGLADNFPIFASEWNAYEPSDVGLMHMQTALFAADFIGICAQSSIDGECFYGAYDTIRADGSWAAMVRHAESAGVHLAAGHRWPVYYSFALWHHCIGMRLSLTKIDGPPNNSTSTAVSAYALRSEDDQSAAIIIINHSAEIAGAKINVSSWSQKNYRVDQVAPLGAKLDCADVYFNGLNMSSSAGEKIDRLEDIPPTSNGRINGDALPVQLLPWSITLVRIQ